VTGVKKKRQKRRVSTSVSIVTDYRLEDWCSIPSRGSDFSLRYRFQTHSGAYPASCPIRAGIFFPQAGAAKAQLQFPRQRMCGAMPPLPHTSSLRGTQRSSGTTNNICTSLTLLRWFRRRYLFCSLVTNCVCRSVSVLVTNSVCQTLID
jgi:hypothetical protein